jgi:hypothetical protein
LQDFYSPVLRSQEIYRPQKHAMQQEKDASQAPCVTHRSDRNVQKKALALQKNVAGKKDMFYK